MDPLPTAQRMLTWFYLLQDRKSTRWQKFAYITFSLFNLVFVIAHVVASVVFATKYVSADLERSLYAIYQFFCWSPLIYMFVAAFQLRHEITALIVELTLIYNANDDPGSKCFLLEAKNESERICHIYFNLTIAYAVVSIMNTLNFVLLSFYMYGELVWDRLFHQFEFSMPWDTQTPLGYFNEILFSVGVCVVYLVMTGTIILTFVSLCVYHRAFYRVFPHSLRKIDDSGNANEQKKLLIELIRFHNSAKGLFFHSAEIYSIFVLVVLIGTTIGLACVVYQIDLGLKHLDIKLFFLPIAVLVTISNLFVYSYYGKMATESYEQMAQCLFESNWPRLPIELQKYFILMIQNTHRPLHYHGFGLAILNLETFTKLIKTVFTYYMMLKAVTNKN